jgi:thermitase
MTLVPKRMALRLAITTLLALLLALGPVAAIASPSGSTNAAPHAADHFLVKFAPSASPVAVQMLNMWHGTRQTDAIDQLGISVMSVPKGKSATALARTYALNPNVLFAEPDYVVEAALTPNDTHYSNQWAMTKISAPAAWDTTTGSTSVTIAIVDTGIQADHPDLTGRVTGGYDFVNSDADPSDDHGHGTLCAGVAAANTNNARGVAGMDWAARMLAVKVLDSSGSGFTSDVAKGITYSADNGANIISLSLGSSAGSSTLKSAVDYAYNKGSLLVAASGNNGTNAISYPAAYANVMAVGATESNDTLASFSNYGAQQDVVAPGVSIASTRLGGSYAYFSGTSAAAPFVAGLAGLVLAKDPSLSNAGLAAAIRTGAVDLGAAGWDERFGWGRIDAAAALAAVASPTPAPTPDPAPEPEPTDSVAPSVAITSPSDGATISRAITIKANASDNVGVTRVEFYVGSALIASANSAPYETRWDTTTVPNGTHTLSAVA